MISKNITVDGRRTSIRLERASWEALDDICSAEGVTLHDLCTMIDQRKNGGSRTSAVRSFIVSYYREVATKWSATLPDHSVRTLVSHLVKNRNPAPAKYYGERSGLDGCTHVRDLLIGPVAVTAYQTIIPKRSRQIDAEGGPKKRPPVIGTCHAYDPSGSIVQRRWPQFYVDPTSDGGQ